MSRASRRPLRLANQVLADEGSCIAHYDTKDIVMPEFASYDEKKAKVYRYRKQISVNLGSWFVQENWMIPSLAKCASGPRASELDVASGWDNPTFARSALEKHWDSWVTEDDFAWLAKAGVNTVRLPIGYWSLGPQYCLGTPFQEVASIYERSWPRVLRAIAWAAKHDIGVLVDLHGAVGSQNGQSHSGTSDGQVHLFDSDKNMKKTTEVLVELTKQLVPISNVVGIQILNEPRNVASLPDFYARTLDTLRGISPEAAKFPFYIHDGFNLEHFAKFVGSRKDFVVQDHHSYFVFTPSDSSTSAKDHTSNINGKISSALASASKQARRNMVVDEWSCALTEESLSSLSSDNKKQAARKSFCTSQANVYLRQTAGWSFWSYKTENCDDDDGWCFRKAVGRSLPAKFSVWDVPDVQQAEGGGGIEASVLSIVENLEEDQTDDENEDLLYRSLSPVAPHASMVDSNSKPMDRAYFHDHQSAPFKALSDNSGVPQTRDEMTSIPSKPSEPEAISTTVPDGAETSIHDIRSVVSDSKPRPILLGMTRMFRMGSQAAKSGSTIARQAARASFVRGGDKNEIFTRSSSHNQGNGDGYAAGMMFHEQGGSRLGFATQYMEDGIAVLLASGDLQRGKEEDYRKGFVKGLAEAEARIIKGMSMS